jgi:hypothetical protein
MAWRSTRRRFLCCEYGKYLIVSGVCVDNTRFAPVVMENSTTDMIGTSVVHQLSHRLSPAITWHVFQLSEHSTFAWSPGESILMQLPPDIDLTSHQHSDPISRQLYFTPCNSPGKGTVAEQKIEFILRKGRLSSLIATPRFNSLRASIYSVGRGFDLDASNRNNTQTIAIAGGTGISPFLAISRSAPASGDANSGRTLFWSLHVEDLALVKFVLENNYLPVDDWNEVIIFVTIGIDAIPVTSINNKCRELWSRLPSDIQDRIQFSCRRMTEQDMRDVHSVSKTADIEKTTVYFCGSKSLQWQVKRWGISTKTKVVTIPISEIPSHK